MLVYLYLKASILLLFHISCFFQLDDAESEFLGFTVSSTTTFGLSFLYASFIVFLVQEKYSKVRTATMHSSHVHVHIHLHVHIHVVQTGLYQNQVPHCSVEYSAVWFKYSLSLSLSLSLFLSLSVFRPSTSSLSVECLPPLTGFLPTSLTSSML